MSAEPTQIAQDALDLLQDYPFPGNVRELENVLERAITLCTGGIIAAEHIKVRTGTRPPAPARGVDAVPGPSPAGSDAGGALGEQLEDIERNAIVKALEQTRYNKTAAAKLLGMSFRALRYRIKKLGIE
jgi:two-component system response regulator PilR (NtrC family)